MKRAALIIMILIISLLGIPAVHAQDATGEKDWSFGLAPFYFWGTALSGDMTIKGNDSGVEADSSDISI